MSRGFVALAAALLSAPVFAGPEVGVSVSVGQPGFYGRVDLGHVGYGPVVAYPQPVYLPAPVVYRPYYVQTPTHHGHHRHHGDRHRHWQPQHHHPGHGHGHGNGNGRGHGRGGHGH